MHPERNPVPHPLWALRGIAQLNRATSRSVYRLDQGFVGARLPADRVDAQGAGDRLSRPPGPGPADGRQHVPAAMDDAQGGRPKPAEDDDVDAHLLHRAVHSSAGRVIALLLCLQSTGYNPTVRLEPRVQTVRPSSRNMSEPNEAIEVTAPSVDQALQQALDQPGASEDDVIIHVLSTPRSGVLGLGARQARVRVERRAPEGARSGVMSPPPAPPPRPRAPAQSTAP